jgi:hypothetical protein
MSLDFSTCDQTRSSLGQAKATLKNDADLFLAEEVLGEQLAQGEDCHLVLRVTQDQF